MACATLAGRVVTVGEVTPASALVLAARACAVAARCSAALRGLAAVKGDCCCGCSCWDSLGAYTHPTEAQRRRALCNHASREAGTPVQPPRG
jgi:hypothetical protein